MTRARENFLRATLLATSSLVVAGAFAPVMAGGPRGGHVVVGDATITMPNADETLINQTSGKAFIDWSSFSVPAGSVVQFDQPGRTSLTVNRVTGPDASAIDGKLLANGNIWLLNSNGILFGRGSEVDVGALLATTSDISDDDLRSNHYSLSKRSPNPNASVVNLGTIHAADGGSVVLSAPEVVNRGVIEANLGTVVLGSANAFTVDMVGDNLIRYQITTPVTSAPKGADGKPAPALVSNSGTISAAGGKVLMTANAAKSVQDDVINNSGIVEATSVAAHDGEIDLDAGPNGTVDAGGTLDVSGKAAGETGGEIAITGNAVHVENGAMLDASGDDGGGTVLIGGGFHGKGPIANAATTQVGKAEINVSAIDKGNGGKVAVWSNKRTVFAGRIDARGGAEGGNGGYVETSSHASLQIALDSIVNASAPHGANGSWLLDPLNIIIETGGTTQLNNGVLGLNQDQGKTDTIDPNTIIAALASTNVLLEAANDITVMNDVLYSSTNSLLLLAEHDIDAYANIQNSLASGGGGVYLIAGWDGKTTNISQLTNNGVYGNNGGSIFIGTTSAPGNVAIGSASGTTVAAGDNITVEADNGYAQVGYAGVGGGNIDVVATGNVTVDDLYAINSSFDPYAQIGNGGFNVSGSIGGNINVQAGGEIAISDANSNPAFSEGIALIGNMGGANSAESGNITLESTGELNINASGNVSEAEVGNFATASTAGNASGDITITSGDLYLFSDSPTFSQAWIGNGGRFSSTGEVSGNINISANNLFVLAYNNGGSTQARIANRGDGNVSGNYDITAAGNVVLSADDGELTAIGNGESGSGTTSGNIDVQAGGSISILATGDGESRIGTYAALDTNITVTAVGDIILSDDNSSTAGNGSPGVLIGNFGNGVAAAGGNITVTSTDGSIELEASDSDGGGAYVTIGNSGGISGTSGYITLSAPKGDITLDSVDSTAFVQVGNNEQGLTVDVSGDISVDAGGTLDIVGGQQTIVGNEGTAGDISGSVTLDAYSVQGLTDSLLNDIPNGNFSVTQTTTATSTDNTVIDYSSPYTFTYSTGGNLTVDASFQNSGTGAINVTAGGNILIGGANALGNVSVGSAGGLTTITGDNITVEADVGNAQIGFAGDGGGNIDVNATGNITVDNFYSLNNADSWAQIGNGGESATGSITGNIDVHAGGAISILEDDSNPNYYFGYAAIGNMGGTNAVESGNITVDSSGALDITADGLVSNAEIGNFSAFGSDRGASGNITINSGALSLLSDGSGDSVIAEAFIGNGGEFRSSGSVSGNIDITASSLSLIAKGDGYLSQARITDRSQGDVSGNIDIKTTGNINLSGDGTGAISEIGDVSSCANPPCSGIVNGNITIESGGAISLLSNGEQGQARIADGGGPNNDVSVTAAGDITLDTSGGLAMIGELGTGSGSGVNIDVTSIDGSVILDANGANSFAFIGSSPNGFDTSTGGNITVTAQNAVNGNIILDASGAGAMAQIGNYNPFNSALVGGNITVSAGNTLDIEGGQQAIIGNVGTAGDISGSVTLDAQFGHGVLDSSFFNDIPNGDFTLILSGSDAHTLNTALDYSSPYSFTVSVGGNLTFNDSVQNSGSGAIDITSGGTLTIGGPGAAGDVAVGSAGGTTIITADDLVLAADNGYAQLGFDGAGTGSIDVITSGNVTLDGGGQSGDFAQIGDGGYLTSGSNSGNIDIAAGGNVTLAGGTGQFAYAQIGNGGAESNEDSHGYSNTGLITVSGENVLLDAGAGNASYVQIGNGGYEVGKGMTSGTATNEGDITITAVDSVTLDGNGTDAYAQIGNGGDGENAPNGDVANSTTGGAIVVNANNLSLTGGDPGDNAYAQVGNGDASKTGIANVSGDITINVFGGIETTNGTASTSEALIGNATGTGTVSGTTSEGGDQQTIGTITSLVQSTSTTSEDLILADFSLMESEQPELETETVSETVATSPTPLEQLANASANGDNSYEGPEPSDDLVVSLGQSLDPGRGKKKNATVTVRTLIPGVLKQIASSTSRNPRGVPSADEDYSSWGNEALWR